MRHRGPTLVRTPKAHLTGEFNCAVNVPYKMALKRAVFLPYYMEDLVPRTLNLPYIMSFFLSKIDEGICPVDAIVKYLIVQGKQNEPLFLSLSGIKLTRPISTPTLATNFKKKSTLTHNTIMHIVSALVPLLPPIKPVCHLSRSKSWVDGKMRPTSDISDCPQTS